MDQRLELSPDLRVGIDVENIQYLHTNCELYHLTPHLQPAEELGTKIWIWEIHARHSRHTRRGHISNEITSSTLQSCISCPERAQNRILQVDAETETFSVIGFSTFEVQPEEDLVSCRRNFEGRMLTDGC